MKENLFENEYDHVFIGKYDGEIIVNKDEVDNFKWVDINEVKKDIIERPEAYTYWFKYLVNKAENKIFK